MDHSTDPTTEKVRLFAVVAVTGSPRTNREPHRPTMNAHGCESLADGADRAASRHPDRSGDRCLG